MTDFPAFAQAESLNHHLRRPGEIGVLTGRYRGFELRVDPDEGARIWVRFAHNPKVELRTFKYLKRELDGMEPLVTGFREFESYFIDRYVGEAINDALAEGDVDDLDAIVKRLKLCPQRIISLAISGEGIECRLEAERVSYIAKTTLEYLLPELVRLAKVLDIPTEPAPVEAPAG
jgi:hypothetical protein